MLVGKGKFDFHEVDIKDFEVLVEVTYDVVSDPNYGADADGNRGIYQEWEESVEIKIFHEGTDVTNFIRARDKDWYQDIFETAKFKIDTRVGFQSQADIIEEIEAERSMCYE
jgi:hypothetical protein